MKAISSVECCKIVGSIGSLPGEMLWQPHLTRIQCSSYSNWRNSSMVWRRPACPRSALLAADSGSHCGEYLVDLWHGLYQLRSVCPNDLAEQALPHPRQEQHAFEFAYSIVESPRVRDRVIWVGQGDERQTTPPGRSAVSWQMVSLPDQRTRSGSFTHCLRCGPVLAALAHWRCLRHRQTLLGLAYFWCGAQNAVQLQVWATWLLYIVLIDLTDAVAEALHVPLPTSRSNGVSQPVFLYASTPARECRWCGRLFGPGSKTAGNCQAKA